MQTTIIASELWHCFLVKLSAARVSQTSLPLSICCVFPMTHWKRLVTPHKCTPNRWQNLEKLRQLLVTHSLFDCFSTISQILFSAKCTFLFQKIVKLSKIFFCALSPQESREKKAEKTMNVNGSQNMRTQPPVTKVGRGDVIAEKRHATMGGLPKKNPKKLIASKAFPLSHTHSIDPPNARRQKSFLRKLFSKDRFPPQVGSPWY